MRWARDHVRGRLLVHGAGRWDLGEWRNGWHADSLAIIGTKTRRQMPHLTSKLSGIQLRDIELVERQGLLRDLTQRRSPHRRLQMQTPHHFTIDTLSIPHFRSHHNASLGNSGSAPTRAPLKLTEQVKPLQNNRSTVSQQAVKELEPSGQAEEQTTTRNGRQNTTELSSCFSNLPP